MTLTLEEARREITNAVYAATALIETWEHEGMIVGNGHHIRQQAADNVADLVETRWREADDAATRDNQPYGEL